MSLAPPFRAEHIGSLLRPPDLLRLRAASSSGDLSRAELRQLEDRAIEQTIRFQQDLGFRLVTDGEFRRRSYHSYFFAQFGDITPDAIPPGEENSDGMSAQPHAVIRSRVKWQRAIHVEEFRFLAARGHALPKITSPGPCTLHFRGGDAAVTESAYRDVVTFWEDIVEAFRSELLALADAGCRYVQIDETAFAKFADPNVQAMLRTRGDDWSKLLDLYIAVTNRVLDGLPADLRIGMHLCRGNRAGRWHSEGSYDAVAERLFNRLKIGCFFLEHDSPRAGDFSHLRLLPKNKSVILGIVSTKNPLLEDLDSMRNKLDEASRYVDLDRVGVSPQCGFASTESGNPIPVEMQEKKLRLVVDLARVTWGSA
jgi:5-methyltetrahydropteroyltriglutamate--homocysteine methyltransferase